MGKLKQLGIIITQKEGGTLMKNSVKAKISAFIISILHGQTGRKLGQH